MIELKDFRTAEYITRGYFLKVSLTGKIPRISITSTVKPSLICKAFDMDAQSVHPFQISSLLSNLLTIAQQNRRRRKNVTLVEPLISLRSLQMLSKAASRGISLAIHDRAEEV